MSARRRVGTAALTAALTGTLLAGAAGATDKPAAPAPVADPSLFQTMHNVAAITGAHAAWKAGITGKGVDVALIDTGVAPVAGLTSGNVVNGPDLSFDSQNPEQTYLDGFGHGTHMAGLIVGRDEVQSEPAKYVDSTRFTGMAPDARLINVKVGAGDGGVDVTQVIAALTWIAEHGQRNGLNIKVVSLSYGTDSQQDYRVDPLAHALEAVYKKGITVVVSGGNDGSDKTYLGMPAQSPRAIAVGGQHPNGTLDVKDDTVPAFANRGDNKRNVDLVAPAVSVQGLRVPGSFIDEQHAEARVGERLMKGSGTSQAAAIVAGAAALYLQKHPTATPDQVKYALQINAANMTDGSSATRGSGALDVGAALSKIWNYKLNADPSTGTGTIEGSRGSNHLVDYPDDTTETPVVLSGEKDIFGNALSSRVLADATNAGTTWSADGSWLGRSWTGSDFSATSWAGRSWTGRSWTSGTWAGRSWTGRSWTGRSWTGRSWTEGTWDGRSWTGRSWTGRSWTSRTWSSADWNVL